TVVGTGRAGDAAERSVTTQATTENSLAHEPTTSSSGSHGYDDAARQHFCEAFWPSDQVCLRGDETKPAGFVPRFKEFPEEPVVFLIGQYYAQGLCNGIPGCTEDQRAQMLHDAFGQGVAIGPDVAVLRGPGLWTPPADVVQAAESAATAKGEALQNRPGPLANLGHTGAVMIVLALLLIVPGALAAGWFGARTAIDRFGLIPGMSVVMLMLSGIAVIAVWRGPLTAAKGWASVAVAIGVGVALRYGDAWLRSPLESVSGLF